MAPSTKLLQDALALIRHQARQEAHIMQQLRDAGDDIPLDMETPAMRLTREITTYLKDKSNEN